MSLCNLYIEDFQRAGKDLFLGDCVCGKPIREHCREQSKLSSETTLFRLKIEANSTKKRKFSAEEEEEEEIETSKFLSKISIPNAISIRYGDIPDRIYIRKCYEELYDLATNIMLRHEIDNKYSAILFTGVPGIGKSLFMIYFLWRHQNDKRFSDKRFAFEAKSGVYDYYEPTTNEDEYVTRKIKKRYFRIV